MARSVQRSPAAEQMRGGGQGEPHEAVGFFIPGVTKGESECRYNNFLIGSAQISRVALEDSGGFKTSQTPRGLATGS